MTLPDSMHFFEAVKREFGYLTQAGFTMSRIEESALTAGIEFVGKHVAVSLSLDRRDPCIDCYVAQVVHGRIARDDVPGGYWSPLHGFLISRRRYRGGFREFEGGVDMTTWQGAIQTYARALRSLAPDIVSDEASCLEPK